MKEDMHNNIKYSVRILEESDNVPIDLKQVRYHINSHNKDSDEHLKGIIRTACKIAEAKTSRSIIFKRIELVHERADPILVMPQVREIESVEIKVGRRWKVINTKDEDMFEQWFLNDGSRRIRVLGCDEDQRTRVIYKAGHLLEDDNILKIPPSINQYILNLCKSLYTGETETKLERVVQEKLISEYHNWSIF
jgi:hypothetical protein